MLFLSVMIVTVFAFVLLFALVGLIYPTPLHKAVKLNSRGKNAIACLTSLIICMIAAVNAPPTSTENPQATSNEKQEVISEPDQKVEQAESKNIENWQDEIKKVAKSSKTKQEKYDEVMILVKNYKPTLKEIPQFETYIVNEFKTGKYLDDLNNDEYMLTNVFKSGAITQHYDDQLNTPIDKFAFLFWQNTKYTYRSVDSVYSADTVRNKERMEKLLAKIE